MIAYRQAVLTALQDVEDALGRIDGDRRQLAELEQAQGSATRAEEIARTRYRGGLITFSDVLQAQQRRLSLEKQVIQTRGALARELAREETGPGAKIENALAVQADAQRGEPRVEARRRARAVRGIVCRGASPIGGAAAVNCARLLHAALRPLNTCAGRR